MLDPQALAKLSQLKSDIQATKDYAEGTVAATSGRFGFVRTDDGRDVYLSPDKMDRLLPGDRVKINVLTHKDGKLEAELEKLLDSELKKFVGQYRVKGAGHFVAPSGGQFNRWIFVPPAQRKNIKQGDFVIAKIAKHPYRDGRAQANIVFRIGQPNDDFIEHKYTKAKYELNYRSDGAHQKQTEHIQAQFGEPAGDIRKDSLDLVFFTIDSAATLDMDDALHVARDDSTGNFTLTVAIADPSSFIDIDSPLARQAQSCSQSVYLLGGTVPMLPASLAHHAFSLEPEKMRPALVCSMEIDGTGQILNATFSFSSVRSQHKLNYEQVAAFLDAPETAGESVPEDVKAPLQLALELAKLRRQYRETHYLVTEDHDDYDFQIDAKGKINAISRRQRNSAQQLVEEAMIAANITAGEFLAEHKLGLHTILRGFREERIGEVKALLKEETIAHEALNSLSGHVALMKALRADEAKSRLIPALRRTMQGGELSSSTEPHLGMGLAHYATITSPIRRFADLYNHWCIQSILTESSAPTLTEDSLLKLNEQIRTGRQADRELQQWLICQYVESQLGAKATGRIRIVTQHGFGVKLTENGIEGFVLFGKDTQKTFDAKRLTLTVGEQTYRIDDEVDVLIKSVDMDKRRIGFELGE